MTSTGFSVPEELLRAGQSPGRRRRGHADRIASYVRGVALVVAGGLMAPLGGIPAVAVAVYAGRGVASATPSALRGSMRVRSAGAVVGGVFGGVIGASTVNEAQGSGFKLLAGLVVAVAGAVLCVVSLRTHVADNAPDEGRPGFALEVSHLDFAYGTNQVLFDVSLAVREGEIAALLGTNGAGKSTILRAVAGLDPPMSGTIRVFGTDTTYSDAENVVGMGVALLAGGRMTFPSLTVDENLRVGAYSQADADIGAAYRRFPTLASRKTQRAGTLSGGEQQMLALGRVLLTRPRLLLIDELTLGLAPKVVEELIGIVKEVNGHGTTVLLIEQSVNLALTLADHSYFLERGEVRFDGPTDELLHRDDLLRPVFLGDGA